MRTNEEVREYNRRWRAANPEKCSSYTRKYRAKDPKKYDAKRRVWAKQNQVRCNAYAKAWRALNPDKSLAASKRWRDANPEQLKALSKAWTDSHREYINARDRERCARDHAYRIGRRLRARLRWAVKAHFGEKSATSIELTGCTVAFLLEYLEARFKPGMSWMNYGSIWHIDHRIPCASYDLAMASDQRTCFHYSNLQPLFGDENRRKHAKMPETHQAELI